MLRHDDRDIRLYVLVRVLLLVGISLFVAQGLFSVPLDKPSFVAYSAIWILASTVALYYLASASPLIVFLAHIIDAGLLALLVWKNGGASCPVGYLLPLYAITVALFVGRAAATLYAAVVAGFMLYLLRNACAMNFRNSSFWVSYGFGLLALSFYLMAIRDIRHLRFLNMESEKREKQSDRMIARLEEKLEGVEGKSVVDDVTGLNNFKYFRDRIDKEIKRATRQKFIFSLCIMSVDDLDAFTKKFGVVDRDVALKRITHNLMKGLRDTDLASRYQNNQFVFLLPDTEPRKALIPAKRIRDRLMGIGFGEGGAERFNFGFGIVGFPSDAKDIGGLMSLASAALQRSYQRGPSQITLAASLFRNLT